MEILIWTILSVIKSLDLYYGEHDLAGAILEALIATPDMNEHTLSEKLYEISAENFGKRVHEFYLDAII